MFDKHKIEQFSKRVVKLDDRPQMSAQALKEYFDSSAEELRVQFNALIDTLNGFSNASFDAVSYNAADGKLTFTFGDGSTQEIDLPLELLVKRGHYDAQRQSIILTLANSDVLTIPVSDLIDEYEADEKTLHMTASETSRVFSVKDGVFTPEAPADGKSYVRNNKSWQEAVKGLEEITYEDVDNVLDGVYVVERSGVKGVLCACLDLYVYEGNGSGKLDAFDAENFQTILWSDGRIEHRSRADYIMNLEYGVVQNEDGTYRLKEGYVFYEAWSRWESVLPSLEDYATKTYVGEQIDDAKKNELELIASGVTTEEVNSIVISKDNDGNPFELCDMITIYSMSPVGTNASALSYLFNNAFMQQTAANGVSDAGVMYHRLVGIHSGKRWDTYCYSISNTAANGTIVSRDRYGQTTAKTVKSIKLYLFNSAYVLPVGFEYEIYGRRVKNANS